MKKLTHSGFIMIQHSGNLSKNKITGNREVHGNKYYKRH
jgi:hypothetical protein